MPRALRAALVSLAVAAPARAQYIVGGHRDDTTHFLTTKGNRVFGFNRWAGGILNYLDLNNGMGNVMASPANNYGRAGQVCFRSFLHSGRYNPTQGGFRDEVGGVVVNLAYENGNQRVRVGRYPMCLWQDKAMDFTEHEDLAADAYPGDNGADLDALGEAGRSQVDEIRSEVDMEATYDDVSRWTDADVGVVRFWYRFDYLRAPDQILQFGAAARLDDGAPVLDETNRATDIGTEAGLAPRAATDVDLSLIWGPIPSIRTLRDPVSGDGLGKHSFFRDADGNLVGYDTADSAVVVGAYGDYYTGRFSGEPLRPLAKWHPTLHPIAILATSSDPATAAAVGVYSPVHSRANLRQVTGIRAADGREAYSESRIMRVPARAGRRVDDMYLAQIEPWTTGLYATTTHPLGAAAFFERLQGEAYYVAGTPDAINEAVRDLEELTDAITAWQFASDSEGWTSQNTTARSQTAGNLEATLINGNGDPRILSPDNLNVPLEGFTTLVIKLRNATSGTAMDVRFTTTDDPTFGSQKVATLPITPDDLSHRVYTVDMAEVPGWRPDAVLKRLRVDPSNAATGGWFSIDYVALKPESSHRWSFNTDGALEGWTANNQVSSPTVAAGSLNGTIAGADPQVRTNPGLNIDLNSFKKVRVRIENQTPGTHGTIYFKTVAHPTYVGTTFAVPAHEAAFRWVTVDLSASPHWWGRLDQLRIDPAGNTGSFRIDSIELLPKDALLLVGEACVEHRQCSTGHCVDGVCCDTRCGDGSGDDCQACGVAAGGSADGACGPRGSGMSCNDGLFCTVADTCSGSACIGQARACVVGISCRTGACDEGLDQCTGEPVADGAFCDDDRYCTVTDTCIAGECVGAGEPCPGADGDADCSESCDEASDACTLIDGGSTCDDGDPCTQSDECQLGACLGAVRACVALDDCHEDGSCSSETGECSVPAKPDGTTCAATSASGVCSNGSCVATSSPAGGDGDSVPAPSGNRAADGCACAGTTLDRDAGVALAALVRALGRRRRRARSPGAQPSDFFASSASIRNGKGSSELV
ncbi:MAG: hypothetical protein HY903_24690 [Deltaproteobacteria bacterium]|nr:hypothetical protein [Deltaproteobacteria bacterium]